MPCRPDRLPDKERVVVTGLGTVNPSSLTVRGSYSRWLRGIHAFSYTDIGYHPDITRELVGKITDFDPNKYVSKNKRSRFNEWALYGLAATISAAKNAKILRTVRSSSASNEPQYKLRGITGDRIGVVAGVAIGSNEQARVREIMRTEHVFDSRKNFNSILLLDYNSVAATAAQYLEATGGEFTLAAACASGAIPAKQAREWIRGGDVDMVFALGVEASLMEASFRGFQAWGALSKYQDDPRRAARPFDISAEGFVLGEGAGALVYERLSHAKARNATIYAELLGTGMYSAGNEFMIPQAESEAEAMRRALASSSIDPDLIDYINAHAAGTKQGDGTELDAIRMVFGERISKIEINSTKSMIGHLMGAAGAVEGIATIMALHTGEVHPTANLKNPVRDGFNLPTHRSMSNPVIAMNNSFGIRGVYFSGVFGKYPDWEHRV